VTLAKIKLVAEICAAVAVVLSLVFVGLQVRESALQTELNTAAVEVSAYQDLMAQIADFNRLAFENDEAARVQAMTDTPIGSMSPVEHRRYQAMAFLLFRHGDMAWLQRERGMLSDERFQSATAPLRAFLATCAIRDIWSTARIGFIPEYAAWVDDVIAASPLRAECRTAPEPAAPPT
jgi:hypothetical protein